MKLHDLKPNQKRNTKNRKGRGPGSGNGPRFEGGQMPLFRRLPKRGFKNINRKQYETINVCDLDIFEDGTEVTPELLFENKILNKNKAKAGIKILGDGEITKKLTVKAHKFTKSAEEKITAQGGKAEVI